MAPDQRLEGGPGPVAPLDEPREELAVGQARYGLRVEDRAGVAGPRPVPVSPMAWPPSPILPTLGRLHPLNVMGGRPGSQFPENPPWVAPASRSGNDGGGRGVQVLRRPAPRPEDARGNLTMTHLAPILALAMLGEPSPEPPDVVAVLERAVTDAVAKAEGSVVAIHRFKSEKGETTAVRGRAPAVAPAGRPPAHRPVRGARRRVARLQVVRLRLGRGRRRRGRDRDGLPRRRRRPG